MFTCRPLDRVLEQTLVSGVIVRRPVVTQSDAHDPRVGMLDDENHWEGLAFFRRVGRRENFYRRSLCVWIEPIKFVVNAESGREAAHQWMIRLGDSNFELAIGVVAVRTTAA